MRRCLAWAGLYQNCGGKSTLSGLSLRDDVGDVPHLAAGADTRLAVEMHGGARHPEPLAIFLHLGADEVDHFDPSAAHRCRQRPTGDRADVLLELGNRSAVDGPAAGIV